MGAALGSAGLISGNKVASASRLGQVVGDVGGPGGHIDLLPHRGSSEGLFSSARAMLRDAKSWGQSVRVQKAGEPGPGPHSPHSPLLFQLQPWPHPPFSPDYREATTQGRILPPDSGAWPEGLHAWNKERDGSGVG